ncbi:MAG: zinc ribbon domain-containing protein [Gammaproteobacteria bacterium]
MPIYEYQCSACGHEFDKLQKLSDGPLVDCPECDRPELRKLVSAAGFRLKGSGWYETDFKSKNQKNVVKNESSKPAEKKAAGDKK